MLDLQTIANIIKHGDVLNGLCRGGNEAQTIEKLKNILSDSLLRAKFMSALDGLEQNLRVVKHTEIKGLL